MTTEDELKPLFCEVEGPKTCRETPEHEACFMERTCWRPLHAGLHDWEVIQEFF
jgi:hypothetical protein